MAIVSDASKILQMLLRTNLVHICYPGAGSRVLDTGVERLGINIHERPRVSRNLILKASTFVLYSDRCLGSSSPDSDLVIGILLGLLKWPLCW